MASTKMVTRCPQCNTSFRITATQLQSARGAVRCGACLHIFKARDHLVGSDQPPEADSALVRKPDPGTGKRRAPSKESARRDTSAASGKSAANKRRGAGTLQKSEPGLKFDQSQIDREAQRADEDDFLISDDMNRRVEPEDEDLFGLGEPLSEQQRRHSLFERTPGDEHSPESEDDTDESWAMSLLEEEESVEVKPAGETKESDPGEEASLEPGATSASLPENASPPTGDEAEADRADESLRFHLEANDDEEVDYQGEKISAHDPERAALLMSIDPEPVEMSEQPRRLGRRAWLWPAVAGLALVVLIFQLGWLQFDRLSRIEPYRSAYGVVCPLLGCELPTLVDRERIAVRNRVVRAHPEREDALILDAILLNTAEFEQPFPPLALEFSDTRGEVVAARQFEPAEYLSGELAGREHIPPNQPVHITLELVDPGPEAVGNRAYIP